MESFLDLITLIWNRWFLFRPDHEHTILCLNVKTVHRSRYIERTERQIFRFVDITNVSFCNFVPFVVLVEMNGKVVYQYDFWFKPQKIEFCKGE